MQIHWVSANLLVQFTSSQIHQACSQLKTVIMDTDIIDSKVLTCQHCLLSNMDAIHAKLAPHFDPVKITKGCIRSCTLRKNMKLLLHLLT